MSWRIRHNGMEFNSDDFTIADLGEIEKTTGVPWSIANPLREIKVARAFLAMAMLRSGRTDKEVEKTLALITLKSLKKAFTLELDDEDPEPEEEAEADPLSTGQPSPGSSPGELVTAGRPASPASSG